jgi:predicted PurR-regulated permease PerM
MTDSHKTKVQQWLSIGLPFPLVILNGWLLLQVFEYFQPLVSIFVLAAVLAFILNYPVDFLQQRQIQREYAVGIVFITALIILVGLGITLIPLFLEELNESAKLLPQWIDSGSEKLHTVDDWAASRSLPINFTELASQITARLPEELESLAQGLLGVALGAIDSVSEVIVTVVISFYFLLDGERIWKGVIKRLPPRFGIALQQSLRQNFQNYFIGQVALAVIVGIAMTLVFLFLDVPFGSIFGLGVGILTLIPFGDVLSFSLVSLLVASHDFWLGVKTLAFALVVDQIIDQIIAPRLLGSFTGLSPVGIIAALAIGTKLAGLLGLLVAVPLASCLKDVLDNMQDEPEETNSAVTADRLVSQ